MTASADTTTDYSGKSICQNNILQFIFQPERYVELDGMDCYDYGARMYDAALGQWHVIDPMFEKHYDWSPYAYVLNNPILNIDLYGLTDWNAIWKGSGMVVTGTASVILGAGAIL